MRWVRLSIRPGRTVEPLKSMTAAPGGASTRAASPTAAMRSPSTRIRDSGTGGRPVPSIKVPQRITVSTGTLRASRVGWRASYPDNVIFDREHVARQSATGSARKRRNPVELPHGASDGTRCDVHREGEQRHVEEEGHDAVGSDRAADHLAGDSHVGDLRRHSDDEGEVDEVPVVRLVLAAWEGQPAAIAFIVELMRVVQREHRVDEGPRQHDGNGRKDEGARLPAAAGPRSAELDEDGGKAYQRRGNRQHEYHELSIVLLGGPTADALDIGTGHHEDGEHQIDGDTDVPAGEQAGRPPPVGRQAERHCD